MLSVHPRSLAGIEKATNSSTYVHICSCAVCLSEINGSLISSEVDPRKGFPEHCDNQKMKSPGDVTG